MRHVSVLTIKALFGVSTRLRTRTVIPALLLALVCVFMGCASDDDADADTNGAGGTDGSNEAAGNGGADGSEPAPDAGGEPGDEGITLSWGVKAVGESVSDWPSQPGLEGVEVCLIESVDIPCVYTDDQGVFVLGGVSIDGMNRLAPR